MTAPFRRRHPYFGKGAPARRIALALGLDAADARTGLWVGVALALNGIAWTVVIVGALATGILALAGFGEWPQ